MSSSARRRRRPLWPMWLRSNLRLHRTHPQRWTMYQPLLKVEGSASGAATVRPLSTARSGIAAGAPSGRQRHDEKITVYLSADELVALDEAKGALYRDQGIKVDRGRIVREAVAVVVADLQAKGEASILARRLREGHGD